MSSRWVADAESAIFTILKKRVKDKYIEKYPNLFFTRELDNDDLSENMYPTVYVFFSSRETGKDLQGNSINAVNCTLEIQVTCSKSLGLETCKTIVYECLDILKDMYFGINMMPEIIKNDSEVKIMASRLSRVIGFNDVLYSE